MDGLAYRHVTIIARTEAVASTSTSSTSSPRGTSGTDSDSCYSSGRAGKNYLIMTVTRLLQRAAMPWRFPAALVMVVLAMSTGAAAGVVCNTTRNFGCFKDLVRSWAL